MSELLRSRDYLKKCLGFVLVFGFISLGAIGGCSDGDGSGEPELVVIGDHRDIALTDISFELETGPHAGKPNNILLDGISIEDLTNEEITLIKESYEAGFVIIAYDVTEKDIVTIYRDIVGHPLRHAELESTEELPEGNSHGIFTIEQHDGLVWTGTTQFAMTAMREVPEGVVDDLVLPDPGGAYTPHGKHITQWLKGHDDRRQQIKDEGLSALNAEELLEKYNLKGEFEEDFSAVTKDQVGTLLDISSANIHTSTNQVSFHETSLLDTFQMTSKAWIMTVETPTGLFSFLLVAQDFNLATSNGFTKNVEGDAAFSNAQQYWYLQEFSVKNTYSVNGTPLTQSKAFLLEESPETNEASTQSETTSLEYSVSGTVGVDQESGGNAALSGGVSWGTSTTIEKANVSINNLSVSDNSVLNDATWQFLPRPSEIGGSKSTCNNLGLRNLADLAHNTFQPATAFIVRISPDYVGQTLNINTEFTIQTRNSYVDNCNIFGCSCSIINQNGLGPAKLQHVHSIRIPQPPEGPTGEDTCSDGLDNDVDGNVDGADSSC